MPHLIDFQGHPQQQDQEVRDSQAEEVVVSGCPHSLVPKNHQAHKEIAHDPHRENQRIHCRHRQGEGAAPRSTDVGQVVLRAVQVFEWIFCFLLVDPRSIAKFVHH